MIFVDGAALSLELLHKAANDRIEQPSIVTIEAIRRKIT